MYIAKLYSDGEFVGYLTDSNKYAEPTFNKKEAMQFDSKAEAKKELAQWDKDVYGFERMVMEEVYKDIKTAPLSIQIEDFISNWVKKYYGEGELENPSWNIELLSKQLAKKLETK